MNTELLKALKIQKGLSEKYHLQSSWVIFRKTGERICDFRREWRTACTKTDLNRETSFYQLRRTAVRNMVEAGIPEVVTLMITGLRTKPVFARLTPVDENDLKKAALSLERYFERFGKG